MLVCFPLISSYLSISLLSTANGHGGGFDPAVRRSWTTICPDQGLLRWVSAHRWAIFFLYFLACSNVDVASHVEQLTFTGCSLLCLHLALARPNTTLSLFRLSRERTLDSWTVKLSMLIKSNLLFITKRIGCCIILCVKVCFLALRCCVDRR